MYKIVQAIKLRFLGKRKFYGFSLKELGYIPQRPELYHQVFIHKSASETDSNGCPVNYERLEFLGDSVISSIVSTHLYKIFPEKKEGFLSRLKATIVSRESLNGVALELGFDKLVVTHSDISQNKHIYGDVFEAFVGAMYLDGGYRAAERLLVRNIIPRYINLEEMVQHDTNYKSIALEWSQKNRQNLSFNTFRSGDEFCSILSVNSEERERGYGSSKKEAEKEAASVFCMKLARKKC